MPARTRETKENHVISPRGCFPQISPFDDPIEETGMAPCGGYSTLLQYIPLETESTSIVRFVLDSEFITCPRWRSFAFRRRWSSRSITCAQVGRDTTWTDAFLVEGFGVTDDACFVETESKRPFVLTFLERERERANAREEKELATCEPWRDFLGRWRYPLHLLTREINSGGGSASDEESRGKDRQLATSVLNHVLNILKCPFSNIYYIIILLLLSSSSHFASVLFSFTLLT